MNHQTMISRPAVRIEQGNMTLYLTSLTPRELFLPDFYNVDKLEPTNNEGFQRILDESRAVRLQRHLNEAFDQGYAHLPTTIFLATGASINFDETRNVITFDPTHVCPFSVVDGQHRIEGLRLAVLKDPRLSDFPLPATIATGLDDTDQMYHFFVVNTTQVPVDPSLRQQITSRFTQMQGIADMPYTPHWMKRSIASGRDATGLRIVQFLNEELDSPLFGRVQMANEPGGKGKIRQSSFVNVVKSEILTPSNPLSLETDIDRASRILLNYFNAVDSLFVDGRDRDETVVYKSNGLFFFATISKWIFNILYSSTAQSFTVNSIKEVFLNASKELDATNAFISHPEWWMPGPAGASGLNRASARAHARGFERALALSNRREVKL